MCIVKGGGMPRHIKAAGGDMACFGRVTAEGM